MREMQCVFLLPLVIAAVVMDVRFGRIPNWLIVAGLGIGWCIQLAQHGACGCFLFLGGAGVPVVVCFGLFYFRMIGAGDIKLFAVIGGTTGVVNVITCMFVSVFAGGALAVVLMVRRREVLERLQYFHNYCMEYWMTGEWKPYINEETKSGRMYFSIPIMIGVLCYAGGLY